MENDAFLTSDKSTELWKIVSIQLNMYNRCTIPISRYNKNTKIRTLSLSDFHQSFRILKIIIIKSWTQLCGDVQ